MSSVIAEWKNDFLTSDDFASKERYEALLESKAPESKQRANRLLYDAWKVYLFQHYGGWPLAFALVRYSSAAVHTLLDAWHNYRASPVYDGERERALRFKAGE